MRRLLIVFILGLMLTAWGSFAKELPKSPEGNEVIKSRVTLQNAIKRLPVSHAKRYSTKLAKAGGVEASPKPKVSYKIRLDKTRYTNVVVFPGDNIIRDQTRFQWSLRKYRGLKELSVINTSDIHWTNALWPKNDQGTITLLSPAIYVERHAKIFFDVLQLTETEELFELMLERLAPLGMEFVAIDPGTFQMGSPIDESGRGDDERQHLVHLTLPFEIQTTEVTLGQWWGVMVTNPSFFNQQLHCLQDYDVDIKGCPNHPVENVTWDDVQLFLKGLNQKLQNDPYNDKHTYRLPTEAEWELAARAGTSTAYSFKNDSELGDYGWYKDNSVSKTHAVAQKKPNPWGLYDIHGNVAEWVQDRYGDYPPSSEETVSEDPKGPKSGLDRVQRGCTWIYEAMHCRSAYRSHVRPSLTSQYMGFRLVRTKKK